MSNTQTTQSDEEKKQILIKKIKRLESVYLDFSKKIDEIKGLEYNLHKDIKKAIDKKKMEKVLNKIHNIHNNQ